MAANEVSWDIIELLEGVCPRCHEAFKVGQVTHGNPQGTCNKCGITLGFKVNISLVTYLSRTLMCGCCGDKKAVCHAPSTERVERPNGIYECTVDMALCEECTNVFGWQVEPKGA